MKLTAIHIQNFLGIRAAALELTAPVALICGPNGAGKSSVQEAVRLALAGESVRVGLKKEYGQLLHDGADSGSIVVAVGDRANSIALPSGKQAAGITADPRLPFVLDGQRFARLDVKERRSFLFDLMGIKVGNDQVRERLLARGCDASKIEAVLPLVRAGFEAAAKEAQTKATTGKGAWKAVTNETYGSKKAEDWSAPLPADARPAAELEADAAALERDIADASREAGNLQKQLGQINEAERQRARRQQHINDLSATADGLAKAEDAFQRARVERDDFLAKVEALRAAAGGPAAGVECACPECGALLAYIAGQLAPRHGGKRDPDAAARLPEYEQSLKVLENALRSRIAAHDAAKEAASQLRLLQQEAAEDAAAEADAPRAEIEAQLSGLQTAIADARKALEGFRASQQALAQRDQVTTKAAQHHADVVAWEALAEALGPNGIPAELLAEALDPINERLAAAANESEWMRIGIEADMTISGDGGRPYALFSESEKWRADAMIAEAIARQTGLRLLVLDRADVLIGAERDRLFWWLDDLAADGAIDTALVFMSLKAPPSALPESVQAFWVANQQAGHLREAA